MVELKSSLEDAVTQVMKPRKEAFLKLENTQVMLMFKALIAGMYQTIMLGANPDITFHWVNVGH